MTRQLDTPIAWIVALLAAVVAAAGTVWFDRHFEKQTREVRVGYSAAAVRNPFLAAERFLINVGIDSESVPGRERLRNLPPPTDMLVLNGLGPLNTERRERLNAWMAAGGRILVEARNVLAPDDVPRAADFLASHGVALRSMDEPDQRGEVLTEISIDGYPDAVTVSFAPEFFLQDLSGNAIGGASADGLARMLQHAIGDGLMTVTSKSGWCEATASTSTSCQPVSPVK